MLFRRDNFPTVAEVAKKKWEISQLTQGIGGLPIEDILGRLMCAWYHDGEIERDGKPLIVVTIPEGDFHAMNADIVEASIFLRERYGWTSYWVLQNNHDGRSLVLRVTLYGNNKCLPVENEWRLSTTE